MRPPFRLLPSTVVLVVHVIPPTPILYRYGSPPTKMMGSIPSGYKNCRLPLQLPLIPYRYLLLTFILGFRNYWTTLTTTHLVLRTLRQTLARLQVSRRDHMYPSPVPTSQPSSCQQTVNFLTSPKIHLPFLTSASQCSTQRPASITHISTTTPHLLPPQPLLLG